MRHTRVLFLSICGAVGSSLMDPAAAASGLSARAAGEPMYPPAGLDMTAADPATRPGDDFFQYANGGWLVRTPIPPDKAFMTAAQAVRDRVEQQLRSLIQAAAARGGQPTDLEGKVGAFYASFMDEARRAELGARPLAGELAAIRASHSREELARLMGTATRGFAGSFFQLSIDVDLKDTAHYAVYVQQGGLTMPDRDYYLEPALTDKKAQMRAYVQRTLTLIGWPEAGARADAIVALESRIARVSWSKAEQRQLDKIYNPFTLPQLAAFAPGFSWPAFLKGARLEDKKRIVVAERTAIPKIAAIFADTPVPTLQAWLAFNTVDVAAPYLSEPFAQAYFDFHRKALLGVKERPAHWKDAIRAVSGGDCQAEPSSCFGTLDWAVGQLYTARYFPPEAKARAEALAAEIVRAFHQRIERLDWMTPATRTEALRKLDTYVVKVGYPQHPRDYSNLEIRADDLIGNVRRAASADWAFYVDRSAGPVDKSDWGMTPQTFDAYNGLLRDIVLPAAILQPPEFDPAADPAVNFGAAGTLIGHELTHGLDDQGRKLDADGALRNWWSDSDDQAFKERAAMLGAQYARYEPVPGLHINPGLTMGENIADLGGVVIALDAYHESLHGGTEPVIDGLTGDQRFFRAYAQVWRGKASEDYLRNLTISDPHSWRAFRVNGIVRNVDAWYAAFGVKPGDKLYVAPAERVRIW
ncbi:MAG TPA: M13 family metallopeptidase [Steroidobacteraceae bacterium]|jgi:putative endopeptidase|nr:M13 family metallopeptidase [Steroidobacteraceae bacterium]